MDEEYAVYLGNKKRMLQTPSRGFILENKRELKGKFKENQMEKTAGLAGRLAEEENEGKRKENGKKKKRKRRPDWPGDWPKKK